jgi:hypothetical protein
VVVVEVLLNQERKDQPLPIRSLGNIGVRLSISVLFWVFRAPQHCQHKASTSEIKSDTSSDLTSEVPEITRRRYNVLVVWQVF